MILPSASVDGAGTVPGSAASDAQCPILFADDQPPLACPPSDLSRCRETAMVGQPWRLRTKSLGCRGSSASPRHCDGPFRILPAEGKAMVESMLDPTMLTLIGGTLLVWIGSHAFGVGEFVDLVLLGAGVVTLGFSAFDGAKALCDFATRAVGARSESDLDQAGQSFARAVLILGVSTVQAILLHGQARTAIARGTPQVHPMPDVGPTPPAGNQLRLSRPATLPGRAVGGTTGFGEIAIARDQTLTEQRITLLHELVHRYFTPRVGPLRRLRVRRALFCSAATRLV